VNAFYITLFVFPVNMWYTVFGVEELLRAAAPPAPCAAKLLPSLDAEPAACAAPAPSRLSRCRRRLNERGWWLAQV
jgi:hypothetical protein